MRAWRSSGKPPRYMSPSRSRISLPSLAEKGMLWLLMEMKPVGQAVSQRALTQCFFLLLLGRVKNKDRCVWVARRKNKLLRLRKWTLVSVSFNKEGLRGCAAKSLRVGFFFLSF